MEYRVKPWAHQLRGIQAAEGKDAFAFFFEQGCGKTSTLINVLRHRWGDDHAPCSTLILGPQIVVENWRREFLAYSFVPEEKILCLTGAGRTRSLNLERRVEEDPNFIAITNYEGLYSEELFQSLLSWSPQIIVLDESHKCKDVSSKRTKLVLKLSKKANVGRYILSGTPILNSAEDIFPQFLFLDRGETFGAKYYDFRRQYFVDLNANRPRQSYFPKWVPKPGSEEEINKLIYTKALRVKKEECLDLPPLVKQIVTCEMSPDQARFYKILEKDAIAEVSGNIVSADLAIKKALRLQQVATGFVNSDDAGIQAFHPDTRAAVLEELLGQIPADAKILIWAVFKENYNAIRGVLTRLGERFLEIHGDVPAEQKQANVDAFNAPRSPFRVLVAHPASAGIGVNLVSASYAIFYSRNFSLEQDLQAEARNYRGGSEIHEKVTRIDIVMKNTIDELILTALSTKMDVSEAILQHLKGKQ